MASWLLSSHRCNNHNNNHNDHDDDDDSATTWGRHERGELQRGCGDHFNNIINNNNSNKNINNNSNNDASNTMTMTMQPIPHQEFLSPSSSSSSPSSSTQPQQQHAQEQQQETPQQRLAFSAAVSPMTQTLNVLSQNMDDLRYDAAVSMLQLDAAEGGKPRNNTCTDKQKEKEKKERIISATRKDDQKKNRPKTAPKKNTSKQPSKNDNWNSNSSLSRKSSTTDSTKENDPSKTSQTETQQQQFQDKDDGTGKRNAAVTSKQKSGLKTTFHQLLATAASKKSASPNRPDNSRDPRSCLLWKDFRESYSRQHISIADAGVLGMRIQSHMFRCGSAAGEENGPNHCRVLETFGLAAKYGIQAGDWIAWPMSNKEYVRLALFETVQEWAKERPFAVCILRQTNKQQQQDQETAEAGHKEEESHAQTEEANDSSADRQEKLGGLQRSYEQAIQRKRGSDWIRRDDFGPNVDLVSTNKSPSIQASGADNDNSNSRNKKPAPRSKSRNNHLVTPLSGKPKQGFNKQSRSSNANGVGLIQNDASVQRLSEGPDKSSSKVPGGAKTNTKGSTAPPMNKASKITPTKNQDGDDLDSNTVPHYCLKCNTPKGSKAPRMHHSWCPHNDFFESSGAKEIYHRMQNGLRIGCRTCKQEYTLGKLQPTTHKDACRRYYKEAVEAEDDNDDDSENDDETKAKKKHKSLLQKKKPSVSAYLSFSSSSDDDESDEEVDDASCYRPQKKNQKIHTISLIPSKQDMSRNKPKTRQSDATNAKSRNKKNQKTDSDAEQRPSLKIASKKSAPKKRRTKKSQATSKAKSQKKLTASTSSTSDSRSKPAHAPQDDNEESEGSSCLKDPQKNSASLEGSRKESLKLRWVPCEEDPWGPPGHVDGDVLLYGPQEGIPNQNCMIPSQRFTLNPFAASSSYRKTHSTPEEGYSMLMLRREPIGRRPWGLKATLDEFGLACLIDSVDPLSPATAATYVGYKDNISNVGAALRVNDMLLSVNGKLVGGMTQSQLEVELEISGPKLLLVISRYKHANHMKKKILEVERRILHVMDSAARDDRLIGWTEIGNGAVNSPELGSTLQLSQKEDPNPDIDDEPVSAGAQRVILSPTGIEHQLSEIMTCDLAKAVENDENIATQTSVEAEGMSVSSPGGEVTQNSLSATIAAELEKAVEEVQQVPLESITNVDEGTRADSEDNTSTFSIEIEDEIQSLAADIRAVGEGSIPSERLANDNVYVSSVSNGVDQDWKNDDNAWSGCVCGTTHKQSAGEIFWIQCDFCDTWYDVSAKCVGFSRKEAEDADWTCWGCPSPSISDDSPKVCCVLAAAPSQTKIVHQKDQGLKKNGNEKHRRSQHAVEKRRRKEVSSSRGSDTGRKTRASRKRRVIQDEDKPVCPQTPAYDSIPSEMIGNRTDVYNIDDLVYVKAHSWPGKNCQGGIGNIIEGPYEDSSGVTCYTVRFTVGSTESFIEVEYISPYSFGRAKRRKRGS